MAFIYVTSTYLVDIDFSKNFVFHSVRRQVTEQLKN